jgi:hypothetical protein
MMDDAKGTPTHRVGRWFFWSGIAAAVATIVFGSTLNNRPSAGVEIILVLVSYIVLAFLVAAVIQPIGMLVAAITGLPIVSITQGLKPFMRDKWRWWIGAIFWSSSALALSAGFL